MTLPISSSLQQSSYTTLATLLVTRLLEEQSYFEREPWLIKAIIAEYSPDSDIWSKTYEQARVRLCRDLQRCVVPRRLVLQCIHYAENETRWLTLTGLRLRKAPAKT